ncbi:hypothetical protein [Crocosphaera sp. XPORK-15E]|uniref:hypothetical protein n=1 Tax=Crocosphaera sp. XPORK-15E TaxID=3110247 RepID=UPI002B206406|nr:hypothetical protein [Crocosphaera sp. XPORK-15E]MEA5532849.1 hypothetical protein [Crocosphaera sp. XPORK-15E]
MYLDEQLEILIKEAPQHGVPSPVMEKAVAPTLKFFASQLEHSKYYVLHGQNRSWLVTTLSNRKKPQEEKRVIYGFTTRRDAETFQGIINPEIRIISIPVTHLLFQLFSVEYIDSIIFRETPGNKEQQIEIQRDKLQNIIQQQLRRLKLTIPPNLA